MKVLKSWLKDYVDIKVSDEELSNKLVTLSGFDLESVKKTFDDRIIVGEIKEVRPHPNADRLRLATVFNGKEDLEIVCGAPNIEAGQKVPLATIGAKVGDLEIKKTPIRGIESNGMMCSERELGLGEDHSGIKILSPDAEVGVPVSEYLSSDVVFDLEVTPNRGDCLSHIGIAREIAAFTNQDIINQDSSLNISPKPGSVSVKIEAEDLCPRYYALRVNNVKIAPSPEWLQKRLIALGSKPINNVVDITNYIMLDLGQPLHAFDANKVTNQSIIIRRSEGEIFTTLDEKARTLDSDMLVIADTDKPLALAGIMGGAESGVSDATTSIILEAAEFNPVNIRKTSKALGLATDASYRFERGIDPLGIEYALTKAAKMVSEIAGGVMEDNISKDGLDFIPRTIEIPYEKINNLLGLSLENSEIDSILTSLGFVVQNSIATIPSWRHDIEIWQDLAEEVGRIYGYYRIPEQEVPKTIQPAKSHYYLKEYLKDILSNLGFSEITNYPFLSEADLQTANIEARSLLEVANPVQTENKYLRNALTPNMLRVIAKNPAFDPVLIFEIGNVFSENSEETRIGIMASGKNAKNTIEAAKSKLAEITDLALDAIQVKEQTREELIRFKIRKPAVYSIELPINLLANHLKSDINSLGLAIDQKDREYRAVSPFPPVTRDIALILDADVDSNIITQKIYAISPNIVLTELFDEFTSPKFGDNKKSLAYHIFLQHIERTLTDKEADEIMNNVIEMLKQAYGAEIR